MRHQLEGQVSILLGVICQLEQSLRAHIELWEQIIIEVISRGLQLHLREVSQIVICFSDQFFSCQEGVDKEATAGDLTRDPLGPAVGTACIESLSRHRLLL